MRAFASFPFQLPLNLSFDGIQEVGPDRFLQFTEHDETSPSHGATFYIEVGHDLELKIGTHREQVRQKFLSAAGCGAQANPETPLSSHCQQEDPGHVSPAADSSSDLCRGGAS